MLYPHGFSDAEIVVSRLQTPVVEQSNLYSCLGRQWPPEQASNPSMRGGRFVFGSNCHDLFVEMPSGNFGGQPHSAVRRKRLAAGQGYAGKNRHSADEKMATAHDPSLFNWRAGPSGEPSAAGTLGRALSEMSKVEW